MALISVISMNACTDLESEIKTLEASVFTEYMEVKPDQDENIELLSKKYQEYAAAAETPDTSAVDALFKTVALAKNVNADYAKAVKLLNKIYTEYPESPRASTALFYEGFTYANDLKDYDKAKELYDKFLKKYPNDPMKVSVLGELKNLGKTLDEIIEEFEKTITEEEEE